MYTHLFDEKGVKDYKRGEDYVNFRPDRVAMQDATAQMALLQFMNAGREQVAVPSTVHCDHLIQAYRGAREDIATATKTNEEVYDFLRDVSSRYGIGFWQLDAVSGGFGLDAVSVCVDDALDALCDLTGENASENVINEVFERFCVGK